MNYVSHSPLVSDMKWRMADMGWMKSMRGPTYLIIFFILSRYAGE